jgi:hypothetical protein
VLRHPEQRDSYGAQLVDLLAATLTRVAGNLPPDRLKAEIASALEVFSGGAIALPAGDPLPSG